MFLHSRGNTLNLGTESFVPLFLCLVPSLPGSTQVTLSTPFWWKYWPLVTVFPRCELASSSCAGTRAHSCQQ